MENNNGMVLIKLQYPLLTRIKFYKGTCLLKPRQSFTKIPTITQLYSSPYQTNAELLTILLLTFNIQHFSVVFWKTLSSHQECIPMYIEAELFLKSCSIFKTYHLVF